MLLARLVQFRIQCDRAMAIVRYHRPGQLARRLARRACAPAGRHRRPRFGAPVPEVRSQWQTSRQTGLWTDQDTTTGNLPARYRVPQITIDELGQGRIRILNRTIELGWPIDWHHVSIQKQPPLWRFHLHYHEFLAGVERQPAASPDWQIVWQVVESWLRAFGRSNRADDEAWHPYCISRRLPVWMRLYRLGRPGGLRGRLLESLADQAHWLAGQLERDLGGNHLWENAKALATAGAFFTGRQADRWHRLGTRILDRCLAEQVGEAGEHFERSPAYQADLALGLVDLADWLRERDRDAADRYMLVARRMLRFLARLRHPDGMLPMFGDGSVELAGEIMPESEPKFHAGWLGDYFLFGGAEHRLIFDAGDMGPDHLPAHAHADLLGGELSAYGQRIIIDSGTYSYTGRARQRYRSSAAHNVLTVDDVELADVWSSFRMGRRGHVRSRQAGEIDGGRWVWAEHDAYRRLGIARLARIWFLADESGPWWSIHLARGRSRRRHRFCEYVHWHPEVEPRLGGRTAQVDGLAGPLVFEPIGAELCTRLGRVAPDFYLERPACVFELRATSRLPALVGWTLSFSTERIDPRVSFDGQALLLSWRTSSGRRDVRILDPGCGRL